MKIKPNVSNNRYSNKLDNLDEMDKLLETRNIPKLTHEKILKFEYVYTSLYRKNLHL